jgi:heme A synthase
LALLVVSFFAGVAGGTRWALYILGLIVVQVVLGVSQGDVPLLGLLHGANAIAIFAVAVLAARRSKVATTEPVAATTAAAA